MKLDHVNIRTANLDTMRIWYVNVLGLTDGWRPASPFPGAWLYAGDDPIVHLVGVDKAPIAGEADIRIEHFAIQGDDLNMFLARLQTEGVAYREALVPDTDILQLNIHDPDGNHIHVDFRKPEA